MAWPLGMRSRKRESPRSLRPQLTIKEFSDGLDDEFDELVRINDPQTHSFSYDTHDTIDGKKPLCGDIVAWRHPSFGNLTDEELSRSFVSAHDRDYRRQCYSFIECFAWLLSEDSQWLPQKIRSALTSGIASDYVHWDGRNLNGFDDWILNSIYKNKSKTKITRGMKAEVSEMLESAIRNVGLPESAAQLSKRFWEYEVVEKLFAAKAAFEAKRRK